MILQSISDDWLPLSFADAKKPIYLVVETLYLRLTFALTTSFLAPNFSKIVNKELSALISNLIMLSTRLY